MDPGRPIVFIPGALGTGKTDFEHQLPWFSQTHQVIALDPRGYGESRPPERDYPLDFYQRDAEDVLALMTALGHHKFTVFGWSDGANIGAIMAATLSPASSTARGMGRKLLPQRGRDRCLPGHAFRLVMGTTGGGCDAANLW